MAESENPAVERRFLKLVRGWSWVAIINEVIHSIYIWFIVIPALLAGFYFLSGFLWPTSARGLAWSTVSILLLATIIVLVAFLAYYIRRTVFYRSRSDLSEIGRKKYKEFYDWVRAAVGLVDHGDRLEISDVLIDRFLRTYALEDARQLQGLSTSASADITRPGNRIYTSFVSYSNLVKSVVEAATAWSDPEHGDRLTFLTTLRMPLTQWFNHKSDRLSSNFPYVETDENWVRYLEYMFDLRSRASGKYRLYRVLQACTDCGVGQNFPIIGEKKLWRLAQSKILLEKSGGKVSYNRFPRPFTNTEIRAIIGSAPPFAPLREFLSDNYLERSLAYLVIPESEEPCKIRGFEWVRVGDAFNNLFCDGIYEDRCYVARLTMEQLELWQQSLDSIPNDIFLSGIRTGDSEFRWLLSLGATTDDDCQMVRLEFGTPDLNDARIAQMQRNLTELMRAVGRSKDFLVPLSDWLKNEPHEDALEVSA